MIESPKAQFNLIHEVAAGTLKQIVAERPLRLAVTFSFAQMVHDGATHEQLAGAKKFADILMNLADSSEKIPPFPDKSINQ
jgi:hypothetical protein